MSRGSLETFSNTAGPMPSLSEQFFNDPSLMQAYEAQGLSQQNGIIPNGDMSLFDGSQVTDATNLQPLLNDTIKQELTQAQSLTFTTADENKAANSQPDYKLVQDADGKLHLQKVGNGNPLEDGKLNIEVDTKGKSLAEFLSENENDLQSLENKDLQLLKEYVREMMTLWQQSHPNDNNWPEWWNDVLNRQPMNFPTQPQPVPIEPAPTQQTPQPPAEIPQSPEQTSSPSSSGGSIGGPGAGGGDGSGAGYNSGGSYRGPSGGNTGSSGATPNAESQTVLDNVQTVVEVAKEKGIDPTLAVATMLVESGGDNKAVGDGGHSIGLFQLNDNGEGAGMSVGEREDPRRNAEVALGTMADFVKAGKINDYDGNGQLTPGEIAASAQRPADQPGYAKKVEASMDEAAELIAQAEKRAAGAVNGMDQGAWGGFQNGKIPESAMENVHGFSVAPSVADNLTALLNDAQKAGVWNPDQPYATGTYRPYETQVQLWNDHQAGRHTAPVAEPGTSMHGWGQAIDFNMNNKPLIQWLANNAENYGFKNLPGEPWHYSTTGA